MKFYCKITRPGKTLVSYKSSVKELYFIQQGQIEVLNAEHDEINKQTPILFLPQYSYFGDYQILLNLKSNLVFKSKEAMVNDGSQDELSVKPIANDEIIHFMCIQKQDFLNICEFFPRTKENLIRQGTERRARFIVQKNKNSIRYKKKEAEVNNKRNNRADLSSEETHAEAVHMPSVHQI